MTIAATTARPLQCPALSRDELSSRNVLCRHRAPWQVTWLDRSWALRMHPAAVVPAAVRYLEVEWGGARLYVGLNQAVIDAIGSVALNGESVLCWPQEVAMAAIEFSAELLSVAVETASRKSLQCVGWGMQRPQDAALDRFGWSACSADMHVEGELWLDPVARRFLAAQLREHAAQGSSEWDADWDGLPLLLHMVLGWVELPVGLLGEIELRDVLMLDECLLDTSSQRMLLCIGTRLALTCELRGTDLHVIEGAREIMSDPSSAGTASHHLLDEIPVRLTFDVGEREITLGDLRSIQPGYVFNLGRDPRSMVSIRANGRLVGEGELVDIEGRIGVSVLRLKLEN